MNFKYYCQPLRAKLTNKKACELRRKRANDAKPFKSVCREESFPHQCKNCPGPAPILPPEAA
ncbi:hypothetical protein [Desulfarculus baarsii]